MDDIKLASDGVGASQCPTVLVEITGNKNGPVLVNLDDYLADQEDAKTMKLSGAEPPAPPESGSVTAAQIVPAPQPASESPKPQLIVGKSGRKFFVTTFTGEPVEDIDGINPKGYTTENKAWDAIKALSAPSE